MATPEGTARAKTRLSVWSVMVSINNEREAISRFLSILKKHPLFS